MLELSTKAGGKRAVPDGTMRDPNSLPRGYWAAKDTDDDLDTEITKKSKKRLSADQNHFRGHARGGALSGQERRDAGQAG